jgi:hypothetical protein
MDGDESHKKHVPGFNVNLRPVRWDANDQFRILVIARRDVAHMEELMWDYVVRKSEVCEKMDYFCDEMKFISEACWVR